VEDSVWDRVWDGVMASVRDSVWNSVGASVLESMYGSVWAEVAASVWDGVRDSVAGVWDVGDSVGDSVRDRFASVWDSMQESDIVYGSHDASILAFHSYFREVLGLTAQTEKLSGLWELAQSAGWAIPCGGVCWVSERHHVLQRDDRGRLHCLTGPAVAYPDGFAIYAVRGVRVPDYVIELSRDIDVASIDAEANAEVRRVMIELYRHGEEVSGAAAYFRDAGGERLDHDERYGTLWRRNVPDDEPMVMVEVVNSTPEPDGSRKRYWLRVPPQMRTAREAVAWTFGKSPQEYAPAAET
jgi:hypothetical protein